MAISAENESIAFYSKQIEAVTDPEDVRLFERLVRFEEGHKRKLQREYDRIGERFSWAG